MNFLTDLFNEIDEQNKPTTQEQEKPVDVKTKLLDFEKMIADAARSSGVQPRTYLEQLCTKNPKFAESKLVKSLLGIVETDVVDEASEADTVLDILAKHPAEYKALKDGESLYDQANLFDALFQHFSATGDMPYGTQKARDGDPYEWIEDKLDDLGLLENMVEAFDDHKEDLAKELYYNGPNKEDIQNKYESLENYTASQEFADDATKLMYKFDSVKHVDEAVIREAVIMICAARKHAEAEIREALDEAKKKPIPTSPDKWSRAKAKARSKFDVYPSAYANAYAAKEYKKMGGGWRMGKKKKK